MSYVRAYGNQGSSPWAAGAPPGVQQQQQSAAPMSGYVSGGYVPQQQQAPMYSTGYPGDHQSGGGQWVPVMRQQQQPQQQQWSGNYDQSNYQVVQAPVRMTRSLSAPRSGAGAGLVMKRPMNNQNWNDGPSPKRTFSTNKAANGGEMNNNYHQINHNHMNGQQQQMTRRSQHQQQRQSIQNRVGHQIQVRGSSMNGNTGKVYNNINNNQTMKPNKQQQNNNKQINKQHANQSNTNVLNNRRQRNTSNLNNRQTNNKIIRQDANNNNKSNNNRTQRGQTRNQGQGVRGQQSGNQGGRNQAGKTQTTVKTLGAKGQVARTAGKITVKAKVQSLQNKNDAPTKTTKQVKKTIVRKIVKKAQVKGTAAAAAVVASAAGNRTNKKNVRSKKNTNENKRQTPRTAAHRNSQALESKDYKLVKSADGKFVNDKNVELPNIPVEQLRYVPAVFGFCCKVCDVFVRDKILRVEHINSENHQAKVKEFEAKMKTGPDENQSGGEQQSKEAESKESATATCKDGSGDNDNAAPDSVQT